MVDRVFVNGRIRTFADHRPDVTALAVRDQRIVALGDLQEVRDQVGSGSDEVDLAGGLLVPGLRDSHIHPLQGGLDQLSCDLTTQPAEAAAYLRAIGAYASGEPDLSWLTGGGWSMSAFPGGTPTAALLDPVTGGRPAFLVNRDRHGAWVNTAALARAGITRTTADPDDGRIERDADGEPTGMLHEGATRLIAAPAAGA